MLSGIEKKQILNSILNFIDNYSDKDYQKKAWFYTGEAGYPFDDSICDFFPSAYGILKNYKEFGLNEEQYRTLKKFTEEFQKFADENDDPSKFIDSPEWAKIMSRAKEVLKAFNYQKKS